MTHDNLSSLFNEQHTLQQKGFNFNYNQSEEQLTEWSRYNGVRMIGECYELLKELNIDFQTKGHHPMSKDKIATEAVDIFKFLLNILLIHDIDAEEFITAFKIKTKINWERLKKNGNTSNNTKE